MSEPTIAQDLATLDRVAVIASDAGLMSSDLAVLLERLRDPIVAAQQRRRALGRALAAEWDWHEETAPGHEKLGENLLAAVASVGARIVWPSPSPSGEGESTAGDGTAPEAVASVSGEEDGIPPLSAFRGRMYHTYAARHFGFPALPTAGDVHTAREDGSRWAYEPGGDHGYWVRGDGEPTFSALIREHIEAGNPSARDKILAEVAALEWPADDRWPTISSLVEAANTVAEGSVLNERDEEVYCRFNLVRAAAILLAGALRMDGAR